MAAIFKKPASLVIHILKDIKLYGKDIRQELMTAVQDFNKKDYYNMGYQLGEAGATVLLGEQAKETLKAAEIMQGVMKPFGGHFNLEALLECIGEEDKAALAFDAAVNEAEQAWKDKKISEALPAILLVFAGIQTAK
jgi:hypothetical protein